MNNREERVDVCEVELKKILLCLWRGHLDRDIVFFM